jgi:hypothetical protein
MRLLACTVAIMVAWPVHAADVDWKLYGTAGSGSLCFYEANGIRHLNGNIRVWTKCMISKDVDRPPPKNDADWVIIKKLFLSMQSQVTKRYVPPIITIGKEDMDRLKVIRYEQQANLGLGEVGPQGLDELNCSEGMLRHFLDLSPTPNWGKWNYYGPESSGGMLIKLVCSSQ